MPPVVGIVIAVAAAVTEAVPVIAAAVASAADAIGATTLIAGAVGDAAAGAIVGDVALGVGGAVVGAASGAATAAAAGGSPLKGALYGAATGGLTQGIAPEVADATGLTASTAQSITSGVVTTGAQLARGKPLGTALAQGAASGASQYAAGQAVNALSDLAMPGNQQTQPVDQSMMDPTTSTFDATQPFPEGDVTGTGGLAAPATTPSTTAPETVVSSAASPVSTGGVPIESVTVTGQKPKATSASPQLDIGNWIGEAQQSPGVKTAEKAGLSTALYSLLFPGGGGTQYQPSAGGVVSGEPGSTPGAMTAPQVAALIGQSGQPGGTSTMAPGGPLMGAPAGGRVNAWNQASLRTDQAGGTN